MACRWIFKQLPVQDLFLIKGFIILLRCLLNAVMLRTVGLDDGLSRKRSSPGTPFRLRQQLKGLFPGTIIAVI